MSIWGCADERARDSDMVVQEFVNADTETAKKNNKAATSDDVKGSHDAVMKALADHAAKLDEDSKAPVEIVRDPMGKAIGVKRGARVLNVKRGPDGRPQSLQ